MKISSKLILLSCYSLQFLCMSKGEYCRYKSCKDDTYLNYFEFPFYIEGDQPASCGFPGFNVRCDDTLGNALIELPYAGSFIIKHIYHSLGKIDLSDPDGCLPQRFMSLNLTNSPFWAAGYSDYTLYNCSGDRSEYYMYNRIDCLSGVGFTVLSVSEGFTKPNLDCTFMKLLYIPKDYYLGYGSPNQVSLYWKKFSCNSCETPLPAVSYSSGSSGMDSSVGLILGLPVLLILAIVCCMCCRRHARNNDSDNVNRSSTSPTTIASGLNQITIDSYPVMVIGEGGCQITADNDTCPICLSDYAPHETLKVLPEYLHRFHADCIDQWLRAKAICPICRVSPPRISSPDNRS